MLPEEDTWWDLGKGHQSIGLNVWGRHSAPYRRLMLGLAAMWPSCCRLRSLLAKQPQRHRCRQQAEVK